MQIMQNPEVILIQNMEAMAKQSSKFKKLGDWTTHPSENLVSCSTKGDIFPQISKWKNIVRNENRHPDDFLYAHGDTFQPLNHHDHPLLGGSSQLVSS